ncbi:hypothetical protein GMMP1_1200024 [Candidatus Magnetomoraceae bacterium gMMP-1]
MQENIGTSGCLPSPELYGWCLNICEGSRSDADIQNLAITLAMGTNWFGSSRIELVSLYHKNCLYYKHAIHPRAQGPRFSRLSYIKLMTLQK